MSEPVVLIGAGQHCRVVLYNMRAQGAYTPACILDADERHWGDCVDGVSVVGGYDARTLERVREEYGTKRFFISFGAMKLRKKTYEYMLEQGWEPVTIIHPDAVISPAAKIGRGVLIECGCLITPNPVIGDNVVVNTGSQVNHDNIVEDHVYIASGVILSGGVTIGENTLLDDGVIVSLGRSVGKNSLIGAGGVVTKDMPEGIIAYGNPARIIRENNKY